MKNNQFEDDVRETNQDVLKQLDKEIDIYYYKLDLLMIKQTQILHLLQKFYERKQLKKIKLNPDDEQQVESYLKTSIQKQLELEILRQQLAEALMENSDDDIKS
ncbi:hypothetical protein pb186bvf_005296 [Paramecium bursaria]